MKRRALFLILLAATLLLGSCSGPAPEPPSATKPVSLTALQYEIENMAVDFNNLWFYKQIEEQTGVHVTFSDVKEAEWSSAVSLTFAKGTLPDLIIRGKLDVEEYGVSRHQLLPLDDYMARGLLPNYTRRLEESGLKNQLTASDGHIYELGFLISQGVNTDGHFFINQDWLDTLSLPVPSTVDELTEVLRRFRNDDPNRNGQKDEVPMEFTFDDNNTGIYNLFSFYGLPLNEDFISLDDSGKVIFTPADPAFLETLKWLHSLYAEDLLDIGFISQGSNIWADKVNQGNVGMFSYWRLQNTALSPSVVSMYRVMKPVHAEGCKACLPRLIDLIDFGAALTVDNRDVEASLRWLDAQFETETMLVSQNGAVGDTLIRQEDGRYAVSYVPPDNELYRTVPVICGQFFAPAEYYASVYVPAAHRQEKAGYCRLYEEAGVLESTSSKLLTTVASRAPEEDARINLLRNRLKSIVDAAIVEMITKGVTEESAAEYATKIRDAGWEEYRSTYQGIYDRWISER